MENFRKTLLILLVCSVMTSCSSLFTAANSSLMQVQRGMTKNEVISLMGNPDFRRFNNMNEQWEYLRYINGNSMVVVIDFADDKVFSMDSFRRDVPALQNVYIPDTNDSMQGDHRYNDGNKDDFDQLYGEIKEAPFKDRKMKILKTASGMKYSCKQCAQVMSLFTFDDDKLDALSVMSSKLKDGNYDAILKQLSFISSEENAKRILGIEK